MLAGLPAADARCPSLSAGQCRFGEKQTSDVISCSGHRKHTSRCPSPGHTSDNRLLSQVKGCTNSRQRRLKAAAGRLPFTERFLYADLSWFPPEFYTSHSTSWMARKCCEAQRREVSQMWHLPSFTMTSRGGRTITDDTCRGIVDWTCVFLRHSKRWKRQRDLGRTSCFTTVWQSARRSNRAPSYAHVYDT